jgi:Uma2 family endonuclease
MAERALKTTKQPFTYDDYRTWEDGDNRYEIIDGVSYAMSSPTVRHQQLIVSLTLVMAPFFKGKPCRFFVAPLDVVLSEDTVVQPDLLVVCDPKKITGACVRGAPDLVVEILSPSSFWHDRLRKFKRYAEAGVKEYWLVTPDLATIEIFTLDESGTFRVYDGFMQQERLQSALFPELSFSMADVFEPPEEGIPVSREVPDSVREKMEEYCARAAKRREAGTALPAPDAPTS